MQYGYSDNKAAVRRRLSRIEGQVRGVARMVDEDTYCIDILTQISAIESAMDKVALELLRTHIDQCVSGTGPDQKEKIDEAVAAVGRLLAK